MKKPSWLSMKEVLEDLGVPGKKIINECVRERARKNLSSTLPLPGYLPNPLGRRKR